jgi:hypothetical protein
MQDRGRIENIAALVGLLSFIVASAAAQQTSYYYTCSYHNASWGTDIIASKIDLDTKSIVYSIPIALAGELEMKTPVQFVLRNQRLLFVSAIYGTAGKNSEVLDSSGTDYAVLNDAGDLLSTGYLPRIHLFGFGTYNSAGPVNLKYIYDSPSARPVMKGILSLNDRYSARVLPDGEEIDREADFPRIGIFRYFKQIRSGNERYYWVAENSGYYLLSLDVNRRTLLDSLNVGNNAPYFYLFGLSPDDSLIYSFNMNYNILGGPEDLQKRTVDSSFLKIYRASSFALVDSVVVSYPPLDSGYVAGTTGPIDRVGPYFVYFDLTGEDYRYFSPAMLFIFDTRTNQATWLRVGWR